MMTFVVLLSGLDEDDYGAYSGELDMVVYII